MLRISKLADYATAIMAYIARAPGNALTGKKIAEDIALKPPTVSKILKLLVKAQLLQSKQGAQGGYLLSRAATHITMVDIISAIDGNIALTECGHIDAQCHLADHCQTKNSWQLINQAIFATLSRIHLSDLIDTPARLKNILLTTFSR